jgi:hypothetical protein
VGLDNLEKGKMPEVCVSRANPGDAMFAHQNRRMRVLKEIAREAGKLGDDLRGDGCTRSPEVVFAGPGGASRRGQQDRRYLRAGEARD